jgi:hypothetical protein
MSNPRVFYSDVVAAIVEDTGRSPDIKARGVRDWTTATRRCIKPRAWLDETELWSERMEQS